MNFPGQAPADHVAEVCDGGSARGLVGCLGELVGKHMMWMGQRNQLHQLIHLLKCRKTHGFHRKMINKWWVFHTIDGLSHYFVRVSTIRLLVQDFATIHSMMEDFPREIMIIPDGIFFNHGGTAANIFPNEHGRLSIARFFGDRGEIMLLGDIVTCKAKPTLALEWMVSSESHHPTTNGWFHHWNGWFQIIPSSNVAKKMKNSKLSQCFACLSHLMC